MLSNYFKIAVRNLVRSKAYSLINISGLSLGIACCLLLALYVQDEYSYDRHHKRLNDLYRIDTEFHGNQGLGKIATVSPAIAMTMRDEVPEVESATRLVSPPGVSRNLIKYEDQVFYETDGYLADSTLFDVLTYDLIEGNPAKALTEPNSVVLSETLAHKLFGNNTALNKDIFIAQDMPAVGYKVTGVFRDKQKSFIHANFFTSMTSTGWGEYITKDPMVSVEWARQNFVSAYLKLTPGHSEAAVEKKINEVLMKHGSESLKKSGLNKTLFLEPLKNIYLNDEVEKSHRITYLYIIASIAVFMLLIACINFMNLSTAKATRRAAEIGIRKVMGAFRRSLISQLLGEAMVIVFISIILSVILVQFALPVFNELSGKNISFNETNTGYFIAALAVLAIITGLLAGGYPAFYMSSFQPAQVLKGKFNLSNASGTLRQVLVVFQFVIAIALVCGMMIVSKQLSFMEGKDPGFNAQSKIILPLRSAGAQEHYETFKSELQRIGTITEVSATDYIPGSQMLSDGRFYTDGGNMDNAVFINRNETDAGYQEMMGIKLIAGRMLALSDLGKPVFVINQTAAKKLGFTPEESIGRHIYTERNGQKYTHEIIGVMADYNQLSLQTEITPFAFELSDDQKSYDNLIASINPTQVDQTVNAIEKIWKGLVKDSPFEYSFLDNNLRLQYDEYRKMSKIITSFTLIAMIICSLGLYGLSSFMAERRFKEIGIRKVMGARVDQLVGMMSREFVKLVIIAFAIAAPLAWYAMNKWLDGFAYKITLGVSVFVYAGLSALLIALLTISYESLRAASANPVNCLRDE